MVTIYIPSKLLNKIKSEIPRGKRSQFFAEAAEEKLARKHR